MRITTAVAAITTVLVMVLGGANAATPTAGPGGAVSSVAGVSTVNLGNHAPSYAGPAAKFLLNGPIHVSAAAVATPLTASTTAKSTQLRLTPNMEKPGLKALSTGALTATALATAGVTTTSLSVPPTISCAPARSAACDVISSNNGGATTNPAGINAVDLLGTYGTSVEPPDQGLCAGNGYVMEVLNIGELRVFNAKLSGGSADISLDSLMGLTGLGWSSGGDVVCLYDASHGGHWFIIEFVSTSSEASGGTFSGCFAAVKDSCLEGIAVSVTNDPRGAYNVYFLDPNAVNHDPGKGYLLNDFAKLGNTRDALLLSYDEFNLNGSTVPACPAFGCFGFNGAQQFAINKKALELGWPVLSPFGGPNPMFTSAYVNMGRIHGLQPPPGKCYAGPYAGIDCWYQVIPAQSPDPSQFDNAHNGMGFMLGSLDLFGTGDNRIAAFDWSGLGYLNSYGCASCSSITFGGMVFTNLEAYMDEGAGCAASLGGYCGLAAQRTGLVPLGKNCVAFGLDSGVKSCAEQGIASNGDGMTQVSYAQGKIWGAISTLVNQKYGNGKCGASASCEIHVGAAFFVVSTSNGGLTMVNQGYISPAHEDITFPSFAAGDTSGQGTIVSFTLSGNGGPSGANGGGYFPSSAFGWVSSSSRGLVAGKIYITAMGKGAQDGFTQYLGYPNSIRPRWGDYGAAIFVPGKGFYFASEYIQNANCPSSKFLVDPSCGGTRAPYANWGSSINLVK